MGSAELQRDERIFTSSARTTTGGFPHWNRPKHHWLQVKSCFHSCLAHRIYPSLCFLVPLVQIKAHCVTLICCSLEVHFLMLNNCCSSCSLFTFWFLFIYSHHCMKLSSFQCFFSGRCFWFCFLINYFVFLYLVSQKSLVLTLLLHKCYINKLNGMICIHFHPQSKACGVSKMERVHSLRSMNGFIKFNDNPPRI